jgi:hypothetical protein
LASFQLSHRIFKHAPSLKPRQNTKNPRSERLHYFLKRSNKEIRFWKGYKPNFVPLLGTVRIICLRSRYPKPVSLSRNMERAAPGFPIWPCTRWGFPCRVAYASRGALLPHLFTITASSRRRLSIFCGTVRRECLLPPTCIALEYDVKRLRGIAPFGVRTFLSRLTPEAILCPSKTDCMI